MRKVSGQFRHVCHLAAMLLSLIVDAGCYLGLCLRPSPSLAAENLFLRKQLALYQERKVKPRRATNATRMALVWLGQCFDWRRALGIVKPETFIRWHRQGFRLFWRWKSRPGHPLYPRTCKH
jgi:putative transposase